MIKDILKNQKIWRPVASVCLLVNIMAIAGNAVTQEWSGYINKFLNIQGTAIVDDDNADKDTTYFKSDFSSYTDVRDNARDIAQQVQDEGTVLMTNKENALPLAKKSKVTFFSYSTVDIAYGGTGSGGVTASEEREIDLPKACAADGRLEMNQQMYNFYKGKLDEGYQASNGQITRKSGGGWGPSATPVSFQAPEINASEFTNDLKESFNDYSDAAIFVLTRIGGEGNDLITTSATPDADKYLALTEDEKSVLQAMKEGPFKKRIVLVNTFNTPELGWLDEYDIDACLYIGGPGECGLDSVVDILVGNVNPSGKLADTYAYDTFSSPAMQNYGDFTFANADSIANADSQKYLMYNEGIYVGYRYYETRYEDSILGRGNASSTTGAFASDSGWDYAEEVQFPFGHGLSYTTFEESITGFEVDAKNKSATMTVSVTNTGDVAGKHTVELYGQAPYKAGGIEKSAVQLIGFGKTESLAPDQSGTVELEIDLSDLASYDYKGAKTYVMEDGTYYFALGESAHDALNNILDMKGKTVSDGMDAEGDSSLVREWNKSGDEADYSLSATLNEITNQFETADINYYGEGKDIVTYLSRNDWQGTWPKNMAGYTAPAKMIADMDALYSPTNNPSAYQPGDKDTSSITTGSTATQYNIAMMRGRDYDDENWDVLLDQISIQEMADFNKQGRSAIKSIGLPETTAVDGPAAWTKSHYKEKYDDYSENAKVTEEAMVLYPTETVIAGTWNVDLTHKLGVSFGEEGLWGGGVGWYGPAANIHRTPYSGRNFEYYSEDGFISGKLAEAETKGAMEKGVIPYLKHFFLNDQETNRIGVCTFSNEQAIREVYLRAFQDAFETTGEDDKACTGVMGAFNRLGVTWTGHYSNLWKNVMAKEWGFTGNVTTDFGQKPQSLMDPLLAYDAGTTMFCTSGSSFSEIVAPRASTDLKLLTNMREATHRILYNFSNSLAMNGLSSTSRIVDITTWYEAALIALIAVSAVGMVGSIGLIGYSTIDSLRKKEEN